MLIRQIRSFGSSGKKTGEQADLKIGSLRLLQNTHLNFRGSNFSLERQGGLLLLIFTLIKGFMRSKSIKKDKYSIIEEYTEGDVYKDKQTFSKKIDLSSQHMGLPTFLEPLCS